MHYFKNLGCYIMAIKTDQSIVNSMIVNHLSREVFSDRLKIELHKVYNQVSESVRNSPLFTKTFLATLIPYPT